ncbi:hypothetical protein BSU01_02905 [Erwinia billingiae]|jgi:hypothetical protein|uniref:hypothetical protein n=1 Tax=Erwinia billingiae TaxID=182337 RepID=UPI0019D16E0B|nr:hypothetical protein [Erwinia billingiae]MBN7120670.1 hypothetical protein [Erwinia billingiae]
MKHIGFSGGSSIVELGYPSDMVEFIYILNENINEKEDECLLEQLYLRYVHLKDLDKTHSLIKKLRVFLPKDVEERFLKYFNGIEHCIKSAEGFYEDWNVYKPVKIVVTDMPDFMGHRDRAVEEYDALSSGDIPFWLR